MAADRDFLEPLDVICELGPGRLPGRVIDDAQGLRRKIDERLARGDRYTVAALAGGTGVGKSALLNALLGERVAREGVRRPTTSVPLAVYPEHDESLGTLLDWLNVPHRRPVGDILPDGLVLIDLPDHDSVAESHRTTATRFSKRVDIVIWVFDPIKYTRADSHQGPLAELTAHSDNLLVVLNRVDELNDSEQQVLEEDLRAHLAEEGHSNARVLRTSAKTSEGVDRLRDTLFTLAERRNAAVRRLTADVQLLADRAAAHLDQIPDLNADLDQLIDAVMDATGADQRAEQAAVTYRTNALTACRSPLAQAIRAPLGLARTVAERLGIPLGETSPTPQRSQPSRVHRAITDALPISEAEGYLYARLEGTIHDAAQKAAPKLVDAIDRQAAPPTRRVWWRAAAMLRGLTEATAIIGLLWLAILGLVPWLGLPPLPVPMINEDWSWPAALFAGGLAARFVAGIASRFGIAFGSRRSWRRAERSIRTGIGAVVETELIRSLDEELMVQRRLEQKLGCAVRTA